MNELALFAGAGGGLLASQSHSMGFLPWRIAADHGITEHDVLAIISDNVDANNFANHSQEALRQEAAREMKLATSLQDAHQRKRQLRAVRGNFCDVCSNWWI